MWGQPPPAVQQSEAPQPWHGGLRIKQLRKVSPLRMPLRKRRACFGRDDNLLERFDFPDPGSAVLHDVALTVLAGGGVAVSGATCSTKPSTSCMSTNCPTGRDVDATASHNSP